MKKYIYTLLIALGLNSGFAFAGFPEKLALGAGPFLLLNGGLIAGLADFGLTHAKQEMLQDKEKKLSIDLKNIQALRNTALLVTSLGGGLAAYGWYYTR